jgi:hypothetical protein
VHLGSERGQGRLEPAFHLNALGDDVGVEIGAQPRHERIGRFRNAGIKGHATDHYRSMASDVQERLLLHREHHVAPDRS